MKIGFVVHSPQVPQGICKQIVGGSLIRRQRCKCLQCCHKWRLVFSQAIGHIRRRANLPPPLPGQPGPFSLGGAGVLEETLRKAGFRDVQSRTVPAPVRMKTAADCVRFEKESFGALHQMLAGLDSAGREAAWWEIEQELRAFETPAGFEGPCEMIVGAGIR
jgi:hypothetical protein